MTTICTDCSMTYIYGQRCLVNLSQIEIAPFTREPNFILIAASADHLCDGKISYEINSDQIKYIIGFWSYSIPTPKSRHVKYKCRFNFKRIPTR